MIVDLISLILLIVAAYFLVKTKPNLFLLDLMKEAFGERMGSEADTLKTSKDVQICKPESAEKQ